ncbi:MAG TPA: hypothetical protein VK427_20930 [Kofleriaceae bacterium]|nr:hypothetical protein [Kofleriaceae bacterium]
MANQRGTFAKRNREMKLKDRAREKAERREARSNQPSDGQKGPPIAWDEAVRPVVSADPEPPTTPDDLDTANDYRADSPAPAADQSSTSARRG